MNTIILIALLGIVTMISDILGFKKIIKYIAIVGLIVGIGIEITSWNLVAELKYGMFYHDNYAIAFTVLILLLTAIWFIISTDQYAGEKFNASDNYALVLFSIVGGILLTSYQDLTLLFLGIEILSMPLFILAGSNKKDLNSNESSLKYFMMGSFATGFLLFGIALIYGAVGSFNLEQIAQYTNNTGIELNPIFFVGILFIMIGLGFKVSAAPFHFWTPDVYDGAPTMVTAFMSTIVKTAAFAGFFRLFDACFSIGITKSSWELILAIMIALTILVGNIIAVSQNKAKRMMAYSGIAQAGYILMTILILGQLAKTTLWFYLLSYSLASLAAFTVIYYVAKEKGNDDYESFAGLGKNNPLMAFVLSLSMLSLAGIPITVGFFAKFNLFYTVLGQNMSYLWLIAIAIVGSAISVYYYFKLIISMYGSKEENILGRLSLGVESNTVLIIISILIILLGIIPSAILGINNL